MNNPYYFTYVVDEVGFIHEVHEGLSMEQIDILKTTVPFGFATIPFNKTLKVGQRFPDRKQGMEVNNICNVVIIGE